MNGKKRLVEPEELARFPLFAGISQEALDNLSDLSQHQTLPEKARLFEMGSKPSALYITAEGLVKVVLPLADGKEKTLAVFHDGDFFGEISFLDGKPRTATIVAEEKSRLIVIPTRSFDLFAERFPKDAYVIVRRLAAEMGRRLRETNRELEEFIEWGLSRVRNEGPRAML